MKKTKKGKRKKGLFVFIAIILLFIIIISIFSFPFLKFFKNVSKVRSFIEKFGVFAPVVFIILQIFQILFAPIPGQVTAFVSGYLFGVFWGTVYTMVGTLIGSYIAFVLSRKFGRPFVEKIVSKDVLKKFDYISEEKGVFALFLVFLLPFFPDDLICFIAGLSKIKIRNLVLISFIGRLPGLFMLNLIGNGFAVNRVKISLIIFGIALVLSAIIYFNRKKIETSVRKLDKK